MMISELATKLKEVLDEALPHIQNADEAQTKADAAKAILESTMKELDQAKTDLASTAAELRDAKAALAQARSQVDDAHARALQEVQKQIADAKVVLQGLDEQIGKKQSLHNAIIESMNSLTKRLNLGAA